VSEHPFPERAPDLRIKPLPGGELHEVYRIEIDEACLPLRLGEEAWWAYYNWPSRQLEEVRFGWVAGELKYRGRRGLEVLSRSVVGETSGSWTRRVVAVRAETLTELASEDRFYYEGRHPSYSRRPPLPRPQPRRLQLGASWTQPAEPEHWEYDHTVHHRVDGPFTVCGPAGTFPCLRRREWTESADGRESLHDFYLDADGRAVLWRKHLNEAWLEFARFGPQLAKSPHEEYAGHTYYRGFDRLSAALVFNK
jgi:hypothetical protein